MNDALAVILMDLVKICEGNSNDVEQVLMLDAEGLSEAEKEKRAQVLRSIRITQQACKRALRRIKAAVPGRV